ncbi:hypothetical protein [Methanothrix soehngenii]|uniref:hypothetical protein n=1 Tax=Methanothrix soehngenii TaxID=2223 RepID=UPI002356EA89|nr:hypothetical protein [Methanothrix soehngenii]
MVVLLQVLENVGCGLLELAAGFDFHQATAFCSANRVLQLRQILEPLWENGIYRCSISSPREFVK